ncbi:hypothetical protein I2486_21455 [Cellulophaga sp. E16_2]|uniref:hypothetical protein n=1 Tax=Cellulophaga sp. E16_2 TaxID=2789297 RepID=UPI001A91C80E|nr:hypothetical protein [Cellulophaga sp. E16_2]MBO0593975.1 hypothetical protein [Cellulophaga sp. E16_2]
MKLLITTLLFVTCTLTSCGQKKTNESKQEKENTIMIPISDKYKDITAENYVDRMFEKVKHYDKEPQYFIRPTQNNCLFEILVNDILVHEEYSMEILGSPKNINHAILQSGIQTVTVRMYPLGDAMKRAYDTEKTITTLLPKTEMNINVVKYEAFNISSDLDDEIVVKEHTTPIKKGTDEFIGAGLPYYEYKFTFEADVPYNITGWREGQDLTKLDKEPLEQQVLSYYGKLKNIYLDKDEDALARTTFGDFLIIAQTEYFSKSHIQDLWDEVKGNLYKKNIEFQPFENYIMTFYGNGKIISLRHPSIEPVDRRLRGRSAFWFKYKGESSIRVFFPSIDLYLPKGETLENLRRMEY